MSIQDEPASPNAKLLQQEGLNLYILGVIGFETMIDVDLFKKVVEQTWSKHPRFSSLLVTKNKGRGSYWWKRVKVDIEQHVIVPDLDPNMENPDEFVEFYTSGLSTNAMDMAKPLWEFHVLNVKTSNASSTAILKMHHSLGDGVSVLSLVLACSGKPSDQSLPKFPTAKRKTTADIGCLKRFFLWIWTTFLMIFYTLIDCTLALVVLLLRDSKTPITPLQGVQKPPRRFVQRILSLDDIKLLKNAMKVTFNDVLMGMSEAAISRYLNMRYAALEPGANGAKTTKMTNHLPRNIRFTSTIVYNLRPSPMVEGLPEVIEKGKELSRMWGNIASFLVVPFTIDLQDDPLMYIRRMKATMNRKKLSLEAQFTFFLTTLVMRILGLKVATAMAVRFFHQTTLAFSNLAGPTEQIFLFGHPVAYFAPSVFGFPELPLSLVFHFLTYAGKLVISVSVDGDRIPNPHELCDEMVKSLEVMKEAAIKQGLVKRAIETV